MPPGVPRMMYTPYPTEIFRLPERIVFVFEGGAHVWRNIWLDGRQQPKDPNPTYLGYSTGKWERDTLIVDTMGFNDRTWLEIQIAKQVDWVYDFVLPPLVLHALYSGEPRRLKHWLEIRPRNAITVLDTHDGIGLIDVGPDRKSPDGPPGLLSLEEISDLVEAIHARSNGASLEWRETAGINFDIDQVNCTYYEALGRRDDDYLIARAIQFFAPGVPQVYYLGLLAGTNDLDLLRRTGEGRDINRHYYTRAELHQRLEAPVARALLDLIRFRNAHPAFAGNFQVNNSDNSSLVLEWRKHSDWARLDVDLASRRAVISYSDPAGDQAMLISSNVIEASR